MSRNASFVGQKLFARVWSPITNSPDTPRYGKYRIHAARGGMTREQIAGAVLEHLREYVGLSQPNLAMIQIYDRNGHEIPVPVFVGAPKEFYHYLQIERIPEHEDTALVDASRTMNQVMQVPLSGSI